MDQRGEEIIPEQVAKGFQDSVVEVLTAKTRRAAREFNVKQVIPEKAVKDIEKLLILMIRLRGCLQLCQNGLTHCIGQLLLLGLAHAFGPDGRQHLDMHAARMTQVAVAL